MTVIDFQSLRNEMVARQIAGRGVRDPRVLEAMRTVPREAFVPERLAESAYDDSPLPDRRGADDLPALRRSPHGRGVGDSA